MLPILVACTSAPGDESAVDSGLDSGDDTSIDDGGALTLATCTTDIADDVPTFYRTFFRCLTAVVDDEGVLLESSGLPPHPSPYYPEDDPNWVAWDDRGGAWHQNPNEIARADAVLTIPSDPTPKGLTITEALVDLQAGTSEEEYRAAGVALDGTALFHGVAAPGDDIATELYTFDLYEGHPQDTGMYHHHSPTPASLAVLVEAGFATTSVPGEAEVELYGIMCDGTVVLGCTELDGSAPDAGLDAQRGHVHDLTWEGEVLFSGRYHTHLCAALDAHVYTPEIQYYDACSALPPA